MTIDCVASRACAALSTLTLLAAAPAPVAAQSSIPTTEFAARRDSLAARIDSGVVVAFGGRTPVTDFGPFFQLPAFHYLTNYDEPDGAFVMVVRAKHPVSTLFIMPVDPRRAFYYGWRPDSTTLARTLALTARPFDAMTTVLDSLARTGLPFYTLADFADADFARQDSLTRGQVFMRDFTARHPGLKVADAHPIVNQLRARKSAAELALLRRAAEISSEGHRNVLLAVLRAPEPRHEYEFQSILESTFTRLGGERVAYGSIVGAGENGTELHYMRDRGEAKPGDVVVMDAATQYEGYAADVTRTVPVSGTFTPAQRQIYQLVRDAQAAAERNVGVGRSAAAAQDSSVVVRARGLAALGLIESDTALLDPPWTVDCTRTPAACRQSMLWMIHGISHGLGLAVHDPTQFSTGNRTYQVGDVFTIEPGLYISTRALDALPDTPRNRAFIAKVRPVVERYNNTGVRIEDDYAITPTGVERLSTAPREITEIERVIREGQASARPTQH